jgi:hypothetical protein
MDAGLPPGDHGDRGSASGRASRRSRTMPGVNAFQKMPYGCTRIVQIAVFLAVHFLVFECLHERLAEGVVARISFPAHADRDLALFQRARVIAGSVLNAAVGMMNQSRQRRALLQCHISAIAVAITGTRWNGLAFFGLTRPAGEARKERPRAKK